MRLVDSDRAWSWRRSVLENIFLRRIPKYCIVDRRIGQILRDTFDPSGKSIDMLSLWGSHRDLNMSDLFFAGAIYLYFCIVWDDGFAIDSGKIDGPYSEGVTSHRRCLSVPIVYRIST